MKDHVPALALVGVFDDRTAAEIACALLSEASLDPDGPEAEANGTWSVGLRGITPELLSRGEVILRSARARATSTSVHHNPPLAATPIP